MFSSDVSLLYNTHNIVNNAILNTSKACKLNIYVFDISIWKVRRGRFKYIYIYICSGSVTGIDYKLLNPKPSYKYVNILSVAPNHISLVIELTRVSHLMSQGFT